MSKQAMLLDPNCTMESPRELETITNAQGASPHTVCLSAGIVAVVLLLLFCFELSCDYNVPPGLRTTTTGPCRVSKKMFTKTSWKMTKRYIRGI